VKRSTTTTAATHGNHENDGDSDGSCNRENTNNSAGSSAHSHDSDVLGGVMYVQQFESYMSSRSITAALHIVRHAYICLCSTRRHSVRHAARAGTSNSYARTEGAMRTRITLVDMAKFLHQCM
jgi:hypothetical protein